MRRYPTWLGVLWSLWLLSGLLLLAQGRLVAAERRNTILRTRYAAAVDGITELSQALRDTERFGRVLCAQTAQESRETLTLSRLAELRAQGEPFYRIYLVDGAGRPVVSGDTLTAPDWLVRLASQRVPADGRMEVLRPLPPGYALQPAPAPSAPAAYLAFAEQPVPEHFLVVAADLEYLLGPWISKRVSRWGIEGPISCRLEDWRPGQAATSVSTFADAQTWSWTLPNLLPELVSNFGLLRIEVDNSEVLNKENAYSGSLLAAGGLLMAAFGLSLWATTRALRKREEYSQAKARFISMVGHELRTPITAIEMYLEILRDGLVTDPSKVQEYHQTLARESGRLKRLVENLLTAGLSDSGRLELKREAVSLNQLLQDVVAGENREGRPVETLGLLQAVTVQGDPDALYGVFANLLLNALKYSDREVTIQLEKAGGKAVVSVADRGRGLAVPADYERIFEPYARGDGQARGLGLGLSLARILVEAHGGEIRGEARAGGGSVFTVRLPAGEGAA